MGRNSHQSRPGISVPHGDSGCMWGIFHVLKYHHWHLKRRFQPKGKVGGGKHAKGNHANDKNVLNLDEIPQHNNAGDKETIVDDQKICSTPSSKGSVKSRIKALISDELSKRKGRHRRSSTYPVRSPLMQTDPIRPSEPSGHDPLVHIDLIDRSSAIGDDIKASVTNSLDPTVLPRDHKFEDCGTSSTGNYLEHKQIDGTRKQLFENESLDQRMRNSDDGRQNAIHAKEISIDASSEQSKEMLDALDMINMNKEFFLKVLQDPGSPLAHHFHNQQTFSSKKGYYKSVLFPSHVLSSKEGSGPSILKQKQQRIDLNAKEENLQAGNQTKMAENSIDYIHSQSMPSIAGAYRADGILKLNQAMAEVTGKKHGHNPMVIKHFKNLKQKIKHAIKEGTNEKHRVSMDAILHKIPHGHGFSRADNMKNYRMFIEDIDSPTSSCDSARSLPSRRKGERCCIRRTSSLSESMDRYCHLYESSISREAQQLEGHSPSISDSTSIRRNFSLPNLKSYVHRSEDTPLDAFPSSKLKAAVDDSTSKCDPSEQKSVEHPTASEYPSELDTKCLVESNIPNNLDEETFSNRLGMTAALYNEPDAKAEVISDDLVNMSTENNTRHDLQDFQFPNQSTTKQSGLLTVPLHSSEFQEDTTNTSFSISDAEPSSWHLVPNQTNSPEVRLVEDMLEAAEDGVDKTSKNLSNDILQFQVDGKEKPEYDYVRDVLRLSGFTGGELLGTWHSDGQPMDPSLLQEVEGCMLLDPDCSGNEEGGNCYHLMLFDLINEVLMEMYAKSYSYCPALLSSLSQIRPVPVGPRVLEEVWEHIRWYLDSTPEADNVLDYAVNKDLTKSDGWMNLQFDTECVGLELEDLIFDDLLVEAISTWVFVK